MPFIDEILNNINTIICDLQPQQVGYSCLYISIFQETSFCRSLFLEPLSQWFEIKGGISLHRCASLDPDTHTVDFMYILGLSREIDAIKHL